MTLLKAAPAFAFLGMLCACGGEQTAAENTAQALENAAEQSTPQAANVLQAEADRLREQNGAAPAGQPGSAGQQALEKAAAAEKAAGAPQDAPPPVGAKPRAPGDPVPPPKVRPPPASK